MSKDYDMIDCCGSCSYCVSGIVWGYCGFGEDVVEVMPYWHCDKYRPGNGLTYPPIKKSRED